MKHLPTLWLLALLLGWAACDECPECSEPTAALRFQLVDALGHDLALGPNAPYPKDSVRLTYTENGTERFSTVRIDSSQIGRILFEVPGATLLAARGINRYALHLHHTTDSLEVGYAQVSTVCCTYKLFNYLRVNGLSQEPADFDPYVFLIRK